MYRIILQLTTAALLFASTGLQAQIKNGQLSNWVQAQSVGEPFYNPDQWETSNYSMLTRAIVSVEEIVNGSNSIAHVSSSTQGIDAISSGHISQSIPTIGASVITLWAKCDSLYGNSGCVMAVKALDGTVLQTDTTRTVDANFRNYQMIVDPAIIATYDTITVWIEAQGAIDMWDEEADGFSVFLIDEVRVTPEPLNFEFLDHRSKAITLEAALEISEGLLYVSCDNQSRNTTVNLANGNCNLQKLFRNEDKMEDSHIQIINDSTQVVFLENFDGFDVSFGGFIAIRIENGVVVDVFNDFDLNFEDGIWQYAWLIEHVQLDTLGNWIIDSRDQGFFQYRDSILTPLNIQGDLFLNKSGDWFLYDETNLSAYDGTASTLLLSNQDIIDLKFHDAYNYLLSSDTLYRYNDQFTSLESKWALPVNNLSFDNILLSDSKISFLINETNEFSVIEISGGQEIERRFPKEPSENLGMLSTRTNDKIMFSGAFNLDDINHLFFREFSLTENNFYDRVDLSIDDYRIEYDSTFFRVDPIITYDTTFYNTYDFSTEITNLQDRSIFNIGAYSKNYNSLSFYPSTFLTVQLDNDILPFGSYINNEKISDVYGNACLNSALELHITGANFKFNQNENRTLTPDFLSSVSSIEELNIKVYPNPFVDYVNLEGILNFHSWQLYDINGRLLRKGDSSQYNLDLGGLTAGSFVLLLTTQNGEQYRQILVKP